MILKIDGSFSIEASTMSVNNGAGVEWLSVGYDEYRIRLTAEGVYTFTANVTGPDGNTYQDTIAITVLNKTELDALLKGKWEGMKGALMAGDIEKALTHFAEPAREQYREMFQLLQLQLPTLVSQMREISLMEVTGNVAEYYITRPQRGTDISYFIYFVKGNDGIWRIQGF